MNLTDNEIIKAFEDAVICVGQAPFVEKVAKGEQLKSDIIDLINRQKSETIKEFAKRLIKSYESVDGQYVDRVMRNDIDNLVKEMTENDFKE